MGLFAQQKAHKALGKVKIKVQVEYDYLVFTPSNKSKAIDGKLPLLVFLHGAGERGDDLSLLSTTHGPPMLVEKDSDFPFIVLSPQCPEGDRWNALQVRLLVDHIVKKYPVDASRIYLTGLSMGGFGTWDTAIHHPNYFAAIAPICGGSIIHAFQAKRIKHIPTWAFHGAKDQVVPVDNTRRIVKALKEEKSDVKYTEYPEAGHNSWTETYNNPALYTWLLQQRLKP